MNDQSPQTDSYSTSMRFGPTCGLSTQQQAEIEGRFEVFIQRLLGFGLTHVFYRSVYVDPTLGDVERCDLMYSDANFIRLYYEQNLGPTFSAMCQNQPPYKLAFFPPPTTLTDRHTQILEAGARLGMFYDFFYLFRDCPMSGGGLSGGRAFEKLDKASLYAALGAGVEFHEAVNKIFGEAAERQLNLTDNEVKYLQLMFYGLSSKDIASESNVTLNWVAKTCMNIRRKLGVASNAAAVAKAVVCQILR